MQNDSLWQAVLGEIELSVSRGNFLTWFKKTHLVKSDETEVVIGCPNVFIKQQLEKKYSSLVSDVLVKNGVKTKSIEYRISTTNESRPAYEDVVGFDDVDESLIEEEPRVKVATGSSLSHSYRQGLNDRYTLDNFVVGASNELAFAACQAITNEPGKKYNPLFIYGGVGIGKTHLIQAVGNSLTISHPDLRILYISTEQFVQEFVDALRFRKTADFAGYYRSADVLIVDDIQFIAGKEKIQEEFFHTFNALHHANKQIIVSSDKPPKDIPTLEERLKSRLTWGMSIDMQTPDFETRCAIIQAKAQSGGVDLSQDVVEFLSNNIPTNIRELEGALNQLLAFCEMRTLEPSLAVATSLLGSIKARPKHLSAKQIIERTSRHFQIPIEDMVGPKRDKDIVVPRQIAMYMLRNELRLSYPKIARELGRKDHTTAIHSVDKIERQSRIDPGLRQAISDIKERLYA